MEQDEAGRLKAFREKFGRGWDLGAESGEVEEGGKGEGEKVEGGRREDESLMDLISGAAGVERDVKGKAREDLGEEEGKGKGKKGR